MKFEVNIAIRRRIKQGAIAGLASISGVLTLVAIIGVWEALSRLYPIILVIAALAALAGAIVRPLPCYAAAMLGGVIGFALSVLVLLQAAAQI